MLKISSLLVIKSGQVSAKRSASGIKAVIFDLAGVLINSPVAHFRKFERINGLPSQILLNVLVNKSENGSWDQLERGQIDLKKFYLLFNEECSEMAHQKIDTTGLLDVSYNIRVYHKMMDCVKLLKADGYKTGLLTNNWFINEKDTLLPSDTTIFDSVVESCKLGIRKPDKRIFKYAMQELDVQPFETIFIDDLNVNIRAASSLGMQTILATSSENVLSELEVLLNSPMRGYAPGTRPVSSNLEIDVTSLKNYLDEVLDVQSSNLPTIRSFTHGQSNPTYYITHEGRELVLRKKPPGKLLPSAHQVEREYSVMKALSDQGVPTPKMVALCEDSSAIGSTFYLMEYLPGRIIKSDTLHEYSPKDRRDFYLEMIRILSLIHRANIHSCGLKVPSKENLNKETFLSRQINRWWKQYESSATVEMPEIHQLKDWLLARLPANEKVGVVHGDFRLDNLIFHSVENRVIGVIDWELSAIGDPIVDLASCLLYHILPPTIPLFGQFGGDSSLPQGIPTFQELLSEYCRCIGMDKIDNMDLYVGFVCFRAAAMLQGLYKRALAGQASSPNAQYVGSFSKEIATIGFRLTQSSHLSPTSSN